MAEMDDTVNAFGKKVAFLTLKISLLHVVGNRSNEAKLLFLSGRINPQLNFSTGQKNKNGTGCKVISLNLWMCMGSLPTPSPPSLRTLIWMR